MYCENYSQSLKFSPLSNNTVLTQMSEDIKEQVANQIKRSPKSALQTDASTKVAGLPLLLPLSDTFF
jgi:hypothetical protein